MAKNTLTFEEVKPTGSIVVGTTLTPTDKTKYTGDTVTLGAGDSLTIKAFDSFSKVTLAESDGTTVEELTADSPSYTNEGNSSETLNFVVANKGAAVRYAFAQAPVAAGWDVEDENYEEITVGEDTYYADPTSYTTPIELEAGDTIRLATADPRGASTLIAIIKESEGGDNISTRSASVEYEFVRLRDTGWTATEDTSLIICGQSQYTAEDVEYQIIKQGVVEIDEAFAPTELYINTEKVVILKEGDTLKNTTSGKSIILLDSKGNELTTLGNGSSFTTMDYCVVLLGCKTSGATLTYELTPASKEFVAEYTDGSGILQLRRVEGGKIRFFASADSDDGYMQVWETKAKEIMYYINMTCLDGVKIVSETEVLSATINEE